jgi:hypothetical protein
MPSYRIIHDSSPLASPQLHAGPRGNTTAIITIINVPPPSQQRASSISPSPPLSLHRPATLALPLIRPNPAPHSPGTRGGSRVARPGSTTSTLINVASALRIWTSAADLRVLGLAGTSLLAAQARGSTSTGSASHPSPIAPTTSSSVAVPLKSAFPLRPFCCILLHNIRRKTSQNHAGRSGQIAEF